MGRNERLMKWGLGFYLALGVASQLTAKDTKKVEDIANSNVVVHIEDAGCRNYQQMAPEFNLGPAYMLPDCADRYLR